MLVFWENNYAQDTLDSANSTEIVKTDTNSISPVDDQRFKRSGTRYLGQL